ncbi:hypothetical protein GCM10010278_75960 [Streptomyces melanogenes]|nr:hypothetical protein GCM10010278_75960 [Streptomyces melanogenes]
MVWTVLGALVLASCEASSQENPGPPKDTSQVGSGFVVRYETPATTDRREAALLRMGKVLEKGAAALDTFLVLDRTVTVVGRSCHGQGSSYDAESRRLEICYDEVAEDRSLFQEARDPRPDDAATAVVAETVFHEAGHALVDDLRLSLSDRNEEDAADQFAALMLIRQGVEGERQLRQAAREYELSAPTGDASATDDRDEHSSDLQRAANHLCYLYGASPTRNADLVHTRYLSARRAAGCGTEWAHVRSTWTRNLAPALR